MPFAVVVAASGLASGPVAVAFAGGYGVPVAGADFPPVVEFFAAVAGAFAQGAGIPDVVVAATFVAAVVVSVLSWYHVHFALDDRENSTWRCLATAFCSAEMRAADRHACANSAATPVEWVGLAPLGGERPERQGSDAIHSVVEIGLIYCE